MKTESSIPQCKDLQPPLVFHLWAWEFTLLLSPSWSPPLSSFYRVWAFVLLLLMLLLFSMLLLSEMMWDLHLENMAKYELIMLSLLRMWSRHPWVRVCDWLRNIKKFAIGPLGSRGQLSNHAFTHKNGFLSWRIQSSFCAKTSHHVVRHQLLSAAMMESLTCTQGATQPSHEQ